MTPGWYRTTDVQVCGGCGLRQAVGVPMRRLRTGRVRCQFCAKQLLGEDVPGELPAAPVPAPKPAAEAGPLQPFVERMRRQLGIDVKARAAGGDR